MKKRAPIILWIVIVCLVIFSAYLFWYFSGRTIAVKPTLARPSEVTSFGTNTGRGNIVGIQPFLATTDYASEERFYTVLNSYFAIAKQQGWLTPQTVIALPEFIGTWLIAANEKTDVYKASNLNDAMIPVILCHFFPAVKEYLAARGSKNAKDVLTYTLFQLKAKTAARIYQNVFSRLAKQYQVTVVAGSAILPSPRISNGKLEISKGGKLYNTSIVYKPDGLAYDKLIRKAYLTSVEIPFTSSAPVEELPVFDTPAGRLGVLICADAWYPSSYAVLKEQKVDFIVVPSYKSIDSKLSNPWGGYDGNPAPNDVDLTDYQKLTEETSLIKYALIGRIASSGAKYGVNVFIRGDFWGMGSDGYTMISDNGKFLRGQLVDGSALINLWFQ